MSNLWEINKEYKDKGENHPEDEFASAFRVSISQGWGIANSSGIRVLTAGENGVKKYKSGYACLILISALIETAWDNPWDDKINDNGDLFYWGDAKYRDGYSILDWNGNKRIDKVHDHIVLDQKRMVPPILYFQKKRPGIMTFQGLFKLLSVKKEMYLDPETTKKVLNLKAHCKRLTTNPISQKWIISRAKNGSDDESLAPKEWIEYISS